MWPSHSYRGPLDLLKKLDFDSDDGARTGCLFLSAVLESLLEDALWNMFQQGNVQANVTLTFMARLNGRKALLDAYKGLVGKSAADVLGEAGLASWWNDWEALVSARNGLAHGGWHTRELKKPLPALVKATWEDSLRALACLRNAGVDAMSAQATHVLIDEVPDE
jgi:hypothetical protein